MSTLLWAVRSALVSTFTGAVGVDVFDGPMTKTTPPSSFLLVGTDGGDIGDGMRGVDDGATAEQAASTLSGSNMRDETGEVVCAAWAWSGGTDFVPLRAAAKAVVDLAEVTVAGDRTLGGLLVAPGLAEFRSLRLREAQTDRGAVVRAVFTVGYGALVIN